MDPSHTPTIPVPPVPVWEVVPVVEPAPPRAEPPPLLEALPDPADVPTLKPADVPTLKRAKGIPPGALSAEERDRPGLVGTAQRVSHRFDVVVESVLGVFCLP